MALQYRTAENKVIVLNYCSNRCNRLVHLATPGTADNGRLSFWHCRSVLYGREHSAGLDFAGAIFATNIYRGRKNRLGGSRWTSRFGFLQTLTGRAFDYANMLNMVVVNSLILFLGVYSFSLLPVENLIGNYDSFIASIPTIVHLDGVFAFLIAMLLGDFCFYWSHRMIHNVRVFWNLGHIYHHRNENLTQLTHGVEPRFFLLNAHGIASLMLLPLLAKLFTSDFSNAGYFLVPMALINLWIDPSHSVALYVLENRYRPLKWLRLFFMTTCVHYTHHSRDPIHNKRTGCNFGARLTLWDRLFGTYVEPVNYIPESGLFSKHTDYCVNPMRYILQPYIRFIDEFKKNKLRYWPKILFGSVFWSPPNKSKLSH